MRMRLAAFSGGAGIGWGIVIAVPVDVAYQPIYQCHLHVRGSNAGPGDHYCSHSHTCLGITW